MDDIQQGLGRTGEWSSVSHYHIEPDLITFGKSLAGGLPMSAIIGRAEIMDTLEAPAHLFTTGANPVSCEAALATIGMIEDEHLLQASTEKVNMYANAWIRGSNDSKQLGTSEAKDCR